MSIAITRSPFLALVRREFISLLRLHRSFLIVALVTGGSIVYMGGFGYLGAGIGMGAQASQVVFAAFSLGVGAVGCLILPLFAALSITVERQRNTWEILRASPISARSIVAGKTLNLVLFLLLVMVAMLPLVGVVFFYVGIDAQQFLRAIFSVLLASSLCIALGVAVSATTDQPTTAIARTILLIIPMTFAIRIVLIFMYYSGAHALVCLGLTLLAFAVLHHSAVRAAKRGPRDTGTREAAFAKRNRNDGSSRAAVLFRRVDVTVPAMQIALIVVASVLGALIAPAAIALTALVVVERPSVAAVSHLCEAFTYPVFFVLPAIAARSIAREHESDAFDMLRLTLLGPSRILWHLLRTGRAWLHIVFAGATVGTTVIVFNTYGGLGATFLALLALVEFALTITVLLLLAVCGALLTRHSGAALLCAYGAGAVLPLVIPRPGFTLFYGNRALPFIIAAAAIVGLYYLATRILHWRHLRAR